MDRSKLDTFLDWLFAICVGASIACVVLFLVGVLR